MKLGAIKTFKYSPDPQILTGEIEILTNYSQRKKNLELRKKMFEDKEDNQSIKELETLTKYRILQVNYEDYIEDLENKKEDLKFSDLELIFKDLKSLFEKKGFIINWKALEKQSLDETINALAMASPFSIEEKQVILETVSLDLRKRKIAEILSTYTFDQYHNTTVQ